MSTTTNTNGISNNNNAEISSNKLRNWIASLTGVLVVLPALINAGIDIRSTIMNLPQTESEQINSEMFKKYFGKTPLTAMNVPIGLDLGTVNLHLEVHSEGDILVKVGEMSQWFEFPRPSPILGSNIISSANASDAEPVDQPDSYQQRDSIKDGKMQREYYYPGKNYKKICEIDTVTGHWDCRTEHVQSTQTVPNDISEPVKVQQFPTLLFVNCWRINPEDSSLSCMRSFAACPQGWTGGYPPNNIKCQ
jgi:hypothetical protein